MIIIEKLQGKEKLFSETAGEGIDLWKQDLLLENTLILDWSSIFHCHWNISALFGFKAHFQAHALKPAILFKVCIFPQICLRNDPPETQLPASNYSFAWTGSH